MKNYFYIITDGDQEPLDSMVPFRRIYRDVLLKYHFPTCQLYAADLTEAEKQEILTDEFSIVRKKLEEIEPGFEIHQIPRILYDVFFFLYFVK